jgi:hypothetical protein
MTLELNLKQDVKQALEGAAHCAGVPLVDYVERILEREAAINRVRSCPESHVLMAGKRENRKD